MENFISNTGASDLRSRLCTLISAATELRFLVGFFYFSGIRILYEALRDRPEVILRVLVGLSADRGVHGLYEFADSGRNRSDQEIAERFLKSLEISLNGDDFDTPEFYEQCRFFLEMVRQGRLVLRKTRMPNHAKLYLFRLDESQVGRRELFITGSSNLTAAGLERQQEFNVEIADFGYDQASSWFERLWDSSTLLTERSEVRERIIEVVADRTLVKEITPYEAFAFVVKSWLDNQSTQPLKDSVKGLMQKRQYRPYKYQLDAVEQALAILQRFGGCILADVVGLGKSVIASLVAKASGERGIIISPPGLIGPRDCSSGWNKYLEDFELHGWRLFSSGKLEEAWRFVREHSENIGMVIVDEAHRFRNEDTIDYEVLKNICRGRKALLLTATPFNNSPWDILSLLQLFVTPRRSDLTLDADLKERFRSFGTIFDNLAFIRKNRNARDAKKREEVERRTVKLFGKNAVTEAEIDRKAKTLSAEIRDVIMPVVVRRNRLDLQKDPRYRDEVRNLSRLRNPEECFYRLTQEQSRFYDDVIGRYFADPDEGGLFTGALYRPFVYQIVEKDLQDLGEEDNRQYQQQINLYGFMKRLLVKRFESSFGSFRQSILNFKKVTSDVLTAIGKSGGRYVLDRPFVERLAAAEDDETIETLFAEFVEKNRSNTRPKNANIYDTNTFKRRGEFFDDIRSDLALFDEILKTMEGLDLVAYDPKSRALVEQLRAILTEPPKNGEPRRKVVIFTEFADTAKYLRETLEAAFPGKVLTVTGDLPGGLLQKVIRNFDASVKAEEQEDTYDILLSTDRLSEGFNLNRAGVIINYDIPWNPVRVIQRVGRINRISRKVFEELRIINFFPSEQGADIVKSREIAGHKMFLIHSVLGEDAKIFDASEEPTEAKLYRNLNRNPEEYDEESFLTKVRQVWEEMKAADPGLELRLARFPCRVKTAKAAERNELLVFIRKSRLYCCIKEGGAPPHELTFEEAFERVRCESDTPSLPLSAAFWDSYSELKAFPKESHPARNEQSLESKAMHVIKTLQHNGPTDLFQDLEAFLKTLYEDLAAYGTLPDATLRRIVAAAPIKESLEEWQKSRQTILELRDDLGENYLDKERSKAATARREVIVAIENQASAPQTDTPPPFEP